MRLVKLTLKKFWRYRESMPIGFDDMTVIEGRNDAGKSTILDVLDIFFEVTKLDKDDGAVDGDRKAVEIACEFDDVPPHAIIDEDFQTTFGDELLLNASGHLEIVKQYDGSLGTPKLAGVFARAQHPRALRQIDLSVRAGELVTVLGANGAGKSTLMRALSGPHRPVNGRVLLAGKDITAFLVHRIAGSGLVLVPEGRQVFPELSVVDNIRLGGFARPEFDTEREVERMLDRFSSLRERKDNRAGLLSGGEQQMLAIARGLVAKPQILMLDEPSLGLAPALIDRLYTVLAELRDEGVTILLADRGYVIESGRVIKEGLAGDLRQDEAVERAYLGEAG